MERIFSLLIGYAFGLFSTGTLVGRKNNVDLHKEGSGSSGATNALRTMGVKAGLLTFVGDVLKAMLAMFLCRFLFGSDQPEMSLLFALYAGAGVVLGHNFPFYMHFKGGKGVACLAGLAFGTSLIVVPIPLAIFILVVWKTSYVSLGSMVTITALTIEYIIFGQLGLLSVGTEFLPEVYGIMIFLDLLTIFQHRSNIKRLLQGTENKLHSKKGE